MSKSFHDILLEELDKIKHDMIKVKQNEEAITIGYAQQELDYLSRKVEAITKKG